MGISPDYIKRYIRISSGWETKLQDWKNLNDLIPKNLLKNPKYKKTGVAGIFSGSLELVKEGNLQIKQDKLFEKIFIKENK